MSWLEIIASGVIVIVAVAWLIIKDIANDLDSDMDGY